jgi:hypothetical protein
MAISNRVYDEKAELEQSLWGESISRFVTFASLGLSKGSLLSREAAARFVEEVMLAGSAPGRRAARSARKVYSQRGHPPGPPEKYPADEAIHQDTSPGKYPANEAIHQATSPEWYSALEAIHQDSALDHEALAGFVDQFLLRTCPETCPEAETLRDRAAMAIFVEEIMRVGKGVVREAEERLSEVLGLSQGSDSCQESPHLEFRCLDYGISTPLLATARPNLDSPAARPASPLLDSHPIDSHPIFSIESSPQVLFYGIPDVQCLDHPQKLLRGSQRRRRW